MDNSREKRPEPRRGMRGKMAEEEEAGWENVTRHRGEEGKKRQEREEEETDIMHHFCLFVSKTSGKSIMPLSCQ
jgi:hypothetical protein